MEQIERLPLLLELIDCGINDAWVWACYTDYNYYYHLDYNFQSEEERIYRSTK